MGGLLGQLVQVMHLLETHVVVGQVPTPDTSSCLPGMQAVQLPHGDLVLPRQPAVGHISPAAGQVQGRLEVLLEALLEDLHQRPAAKDLPAPAAQTPGALLVAAACDGEDHRPGGLQVLQRLSEVLGEHVVVGAQQHRPIRTEFVGASQPRGILAGTAGSVVVRAVAFQPRHLGEVGVRCRKAHHLQLLVLRQFRGPGLKARERLSLVAPARAKAVEDEGRFHRRATLHHLVLPLHQRKPLVAPFFGQNAHNAQGPQQGRAEFHAVNWSRYRILSRIRP
mmetsp:Transcript_29811/g.70963  ORF Transcript_29811/g.70963 Transcript_29811/m.70963 type:complete len:279 (+) Transcript_29811:247-1083(+)